MLAKNIITGGNIMFNQADFGKRVKELRTRNNYSQKEVALRIGVSEQAVSKWENGECLPDVYNLKLLTQILRVSVDSLLDTEIQTEKVVETITIGGARFEIIEKPETILAGKIQHRDRRSHERGKAVRVRQIVEMRAADL